MIIRLSTKQTVVTAARKPTPVIKESYLAANMIEKNTPKKKVAITLTWMVITCTSL